MPGWVQIIVLLWSLVATAWAVIATKTAHDHQIVNDRLHHERMLPKPMVEPKPIIPVTSLLSGHTFVLQNGVKASVVEPPALHGETLDVLCMPLPTGGQFVVKFDPDDVIALEDYE